MTRLSQSQVFQQGWKFLTVLILLFLLIFAPPALASSLGSSEMQNSVIEWLRYQVEPGDRQRFIELDRQIWDPVLATSSGFQSKMFWLDPQTPDQIVIVIRWTDRSAWKSIPKDLLDKTTSAFDQAMGSEVKLLESREYDEQA